MESFRNPILRLTVVVCFSCLPLFAQVREPKPVTPNALPEVKVLLKFFYDISGKYTLTGQHNYPGVQERNSVFAAKYIGKSPVIYTTDWGFAKEGDFDSYLIRSAIVKEVERQYSLGSIVSLCWHAVPPTANEPVTFRPLPGASPDSLASVQGQLTDQQFKELLTPGTALYKHWCAQVDTIARYLKQLQDKHIPVLWRPYHEMNGEWFWWGGRHGKYGTAALYRQLFDRFVKHHKLRNLIWEWSIDRPATPQREFQYYFPGSKYFDIVALDVYGGDFKQAYYDSLAAMSDGKLLALAEVGTPPSPEIFQQQPKWTYFATWAGMVRNTTKSEYARLLDCPRILWREDSTYCSLIWPFRKVCDLPALLPVEVKRPVTRPDLSGTWVFNQESSNLGNSGVGFIPSTLKITQNDSTLIVERTTILEYTDDRITVDTLLLDGKDHPVTLFAEAATIKAAWSPHFDTLSVQTNADTASGGKNSAFSVAEYWVLKEQGDVLWIHQVADSPYGKRDVTMIYDKKFPD